MKKLSKLQGFIREEAIILSEWLRNPEERGLEGVKMEKFLTIKGGGRPTRLLPHAKMLLIPIKFFSLLGRLCSGRFYIFTEQMWFLAICFTLRGHSTHIYLLWLLFLVSRICPLMQALFLWPLSKLKRFLLRLNKGSNSQSSFWIWITKQFSLVHECYVFLQLLLSRWAQLVSFLCRMLNYHG